MIEVFVDTSAIYAVLDASDERHEIAASGWTCLADGTLEGECTGRTHSSVVVESFALVQARLGLDAVRTLHDRMLALLGIRWVDEQLWRQAAAALMASGQRAVSLVDWTSFEMMREERIDVAFTFDRHFEVQGLRSWT